VLDDDGDLAAAGHLRALARRLDLPVVTIGELVEARFEEQWGAMTAPASNEGSIR
jgi:hypothetical protein